MKRLDFFLLLSENLFDYIVILLITTIIMWGIIKKSCDSLINPLCFNLIMAAFANTVPIFLFVESIIDFNYFIYFLAAELFFWIVFVHYYTNHDSFSKKIALKLDFNDVTILYYCFSILFFLFFVIQLKYFNFGLFLSERLAVFKDAGGLGVISRIASFVTIFNIFYLYHVLDNLKKLPIQIVFISIIVSLFVLAYIFLSGAKSALLQVVFQYYFYCVAFKRCMPSKKVMRTLLCVAVIGSLLIFSKYNDETGLSGTIISLINRMVANGDGYWYGYPNEVIETLEPAPWYIDLAGPFLYGLRIKDYSESIPGIGTQLVYAIMPDKYGMMIGANSRPPIWGYVMFGNCGVAFSIVWGMILGIMAQKAKTMFSTGIVGLTFGYILFMSVLAGITDPKLTFMSLFDGFIGLVITGFFIFIICLSRRGTN